MNENVIVVFDERAESVIINGDAFDSKIKEVVHTKMTKQGYGENPTLILHFDKPVTEIGSNAFVLLDDKGDLRRISLIELPDSVNRIKGDSFRVSKLETSLYNEQGEIVIDGVLLRKRGKWDDTTLEISEGVTDIADNLDDLLFEGIFISSIKKIILPSTLKRIGSFAFGRAEELSSIKLPKGLEVIEERAFAGCALKTLSLPDSIKILGEFAFSNNRKLKKVKIGKGVESIGDGIFSLCGQLERVEGKFASADNKSLIVNNALLWVSLAVDKEYKIPENVTRIAPHAFFANLKDFLNYKFGNWFHFNSLNIPQGVSKIEKFAFSGCCISKLTIPETVEIIEEGAFSNSQIEIFEGKYVESGMVIYDNVLVAPFDDKKRKEETIHIPNHVTKIGFQAFWNKEYKEIVLPDNLKIIGEGALACSPDSHQAFLSAIPESVEELCKSALGGWESYQFKDNQLIIPKGVKIIEKYAISNLRRKQDSIWFESIVPPAFKDRKLDVDNIFVPAESVDAYKEALPDSADEIRIWEK